MKYLQLLLIVTFASAQLMAADVNVDATGAISGSYTTVQDAIDNATDGDRIVIFSNGTIFTQDSFLVDKSLTFISAVAEEEFLLRGDVKIVPAIGREVTFIGMNVVGDVLSTADNAVGARCTVNIVDSEIRGGIYFSHAGFNVNVLYCEVFYSVQISYGKIIANTIGLDNLDGNIAGRVEVLQETAGYPGLGDTLFIIANKITKGNTNYSYYPIDFDNSNVRFFIANNAVRNGINTSTTSLYFRRTVVVTAAYTVDSSNVFMNNYVTAYDGNNSCSSSSTDAAVMIQGMGVKTENLVNNLFRNRYGGPSFPYGCALLGERGDFNVYYGFRDHPFNIDNNITDPVLTFNDTTGEVLTGNGIDEGKPGGPYLDLDLTRNDVGVYGGPYSWENYWENTNNATGRARVYLLDIPGNIYSISTPTSINASSTHMK